MKHYIGIDPGAKGAVALLSPEGELRFWPLGSDPSVVADAILAAVASCPRCHAVVEDVHAMPGQGVSSTFSFGQGKGVILGALAALGVPYTLVTPARWKRALGATTAKADRSPKAASLRVAHALFPTASFRASERCTTDHDGMADAALLAEWGRRSNL